MGRYTEVRAAPLGLNANKLTIRPMIDKGRGQDSIWAPGPIPRFTSGLLLLLSLGCGTTGGSGSSEAARGTPLRPLRPDSLEHNGWDRDCDLVHVSLDLEVDVAKKRVAGTVTNFVRGLLDGTETIRFHGVGLEVTGITDGGGRNLAFELEEPWITIQLAEPLARDAEERLTVAYSATPETGLLFRETSKDAGGPAPRFSPRASPRTTATGFRPGTFPTTGRLSKPHSRSGTTWWPSRTGASRA